MKYLKPLLFLIAFPSFLFAQSNYKPGYVVTTKGDTIKGFIDYREWDATPTTFNFKRSLTDNSPTQYAPGDVSYVNINMLEFYQTYTGPISTDPTATDKIVAGRDTSFKIATVFLKILEKSDRLILYSYKDEIKERFFIAEAGVQVPRELIFRTYNDPDFATNTDPNATKIKNEFTFKKQLVAEALKYNELSDDLQTYIGHSEYSEDDILKIVSRINHITKSDYKKTHYDGRIFDMFVGASAFINTTSPDNTAPYYAAGGASHTSILPQISLGIDLFANPATRKLQFRLEVADAFIKYQSLYTSKVIPYIPYELSYNETALSASPQIIYNFYNTDNLKIFVGVGLVIYHFSYSNSYFGPQSNGGATSQTTINEPLLFEPSDNSFIFRAGVQFAKHFTIIGSYQTTVNNTNGGYFSLSSNSSQIGAYYSF